MARDGGAEDEDADADAALRSLVARLMQVLKPDEVVDLTSLEALLKASAYSVGLIATVLEACGLARRSHAGKALQWASGTGETGGESLPLHSPPPLQVIANLRQLESLLDEHLSRIASELPRPGSNTHYLDLNQVMALPAFQGRTFVTVTHPPGTVAEVSDPRVCFRVVLKSPEPDLHPMFVAMLETDNMGDSAPSLPEHKKLKGDGTEAVPVQELESQKRSFLRLVKVQAVPLPPFSAVKSPLGEFFYNEDIVTTIPAKEALFGDGNIVSQIESQVSFPGSSHVGDGPSAPSFDSQMSLLAPQTDVKWSQES